MAAIIGAVGGIIGGISGPWYTSHQAETSDIPNIEVAFVESILSTPDLNLRDINGDQVYPPYIDIILFNRGKGKGIISKLDLEITNASLNKTPVMSYYTVCADNIIKCDIINKGWGPANELEWKSFIDIGIHSDELNIANNQLNWMGNVNPGETLVLNLTYTPKDGFYASSDDHENIVHKGYIYKQIYKGKINTIVIYKDVNGNQKTNDFDRNIYLYRIDKKEDSTFLTYKNYGKLHNINALSNVYIPTAQIFYIDSIDPDMRCPSIISFYLGHSLTKDQTDRIILKINSTKKSGKIEYQIKVEYNLNTPAISKIGDMEWVNENLNYIKNVRIINIQV
ncbi:MAG: hypothetical protein NTX42_06700 [Methanothrix sp.]|nr:hypothetical protein [Methanothrix sp.]